MRRLVIHDIKEAEAARQQEEQEDKRDEEVGDEVRDTQHTKHEFDDDVNKTQT